MGWRQAYLMNVSVHSLSVSVVASLRIRCLGSVQFAKEVQQGLVELPGFVHVAGMTSSSQSDHSVVGQLLQVLQRLSTQICVQFTKHNQCGGLEEKNSSNIFITTFSS